MKSRGTAFRSRSGAMFIDMGAALAREAKPTKETIPDEKTMSALPWSPWGDDNMLPYQYIKDIETCGVLSAIIEGKARFGLCQGLVPAIVKTDLQTGQRVIEKIVDDPEIVNFLEANNAFGHVHAWMRDLIGFGWAVVRFMLDGEGKKIVTFQRDDLTEVRFAKKDKSGYISHLYYSAAWDKVRSPNDERVFKVRLLKHNNPMADLEEKAAVGEREFAYVFRTPGWGKHYYPLAPWMPVYKWVKISQGVPEMKASLFENTMRPKFKVIIMEDYWENRYGTDWMDWDEDEQEKKKNLVYDEIDEWLVGSRNAHKSIFVNGKLTDDSGNVVTDIDIVPIPDNTTQGELLPDSAAANTEISIGMLWNLATQGGNQKAGVYGGNEGGSNVRENTLFQTIFHEVERNVIRMFLNIPKMRNKWNEGNYKGLEFIIPMTIQTTTDTGAGTKPIVNGNTQTKEKEEKEKQAA